MRAVAQNPHRVARVQRAFRDRLLNGQMAFYVMIIVLLWGIGAGIIINLAALQTVPAEQLEAAKMDGAGPISTFRHVTLPAISPILLFQTVLVTTKDQETDRVWGIRQGAKAYVTKPVNEGELVDTINKLLPAA